MNKKKEKNHLMTIIFGSLFCLTVFINPPLREKLSEFYLVPITIFGVVFYFIRSIISNNKIGIYFSLLIISTLLLPELFKNKKILEAYLDDDRSAVHLILRDNKGRPTAEYSNYFSVKFNNLTKKHLGKLLIE